METFAVWKSRPVFVTSTFRDFQEERDHLRHHVFPELEERLKARFHHLEPIDLRWGVDTASEAEDEADSKAKEEKKQRLVLKVCLAEIERSRPFLIALIGDRYGWVPPLERMQAAAQEAGHKGKLTGKSVTALEIEYGVLDSPKQRGRSRFYFRAPLPYDRMDPKTAAGYSERHTGESNAAANQTQLDALKARIKRDLPGRWRDYQAEWDAKRQCVTGLEAWGRRVLEDLWGDLEAETRAYAAKAAGTWQQQEALVLEQFIETRCRDFVGRTDTLAELQRLARSPANPGAAWAACLTGPAGAGKSALFAQLHRQLAKQDLLLLAHAAGISNRATRIEDLLRRWIGELAAALQIPDPSADLTKQEDLEQTFASLLGRVSTKRRVVCLLDALDQFEPTPAAQYLTWLPKLWPPNARLIATAIPGSASTALAQRPGATALALPLLDRGEAEQIADTLCKRYHKTLPTPVRECLAKKLRPDGQPAAGIPLWLELALDELLLLDADDFARAHTLPGASTGEKLRNLLLAVAEALPPEVETLYGYLLTRAEELHGTAWADGLVNLVALSRGGWRESDLKFLLPQVSGQPWNDLAFAGLRRSLRAHLVQRGAQGQWGFAHAQLRAAVRRRNLIDPATRRALHTRLADHLETLPAEDPLRQTELMYHLIGADDRPRVAAYYGGLEFGSPERAGATATLAEHLLQAEAQSPNPHLVWTLGLLALPNQPPETTAGLCNAYLFVLGEALENQARLGLRLAVVQGTQQALERLTAADPGNAGWQRDLASSHERAGILLVAQGDLAGALRAYRAFLEIAERLAAADPGNAGWQRDLAVSHNKVGDVLNAQGDHARALRAYRASLEIAERLTAADPSNTDWQRDASVSQLKVGDALISQGDLAGAKLAYQVSLRIRESLAALDPGYAMWQGDLAVSLDSLGYVLQTQGDLLGAERAYRAYQEIDERLAAADPSNKVWQRDLAASHGKVGNVLASQGDLEGAWRAYRTSQQQFERLAAADPSNTEWQYQLTVCHARTGSTLVAQGDLAGALSAYRASLEIRERLAEADPSNTVWQRDLAVNHAEVGDVLAARGDLAGAQRAYRSAQAILNRLLATHPGDARWQDDLAATHLRVGDALLAHGDLAGAKRAYLASLEIAEHLVTADPSNTDWQRRLSVSHEKVGDVAKAQGDLPEALRAYHASQEITDRLAAADPSNTDWQRSFSVGHNKLGDVLVAQGNLAGAEHAYRASLEIRERLTAVDPSNSQWQRDLAASQNRVGSVLALLENFPEALHAYRAVLAITERLAAADPSNAGWQHDLWVSHVLIATIAEQSGDPVADTHWRRAYEVLSGMKRAGLFVSPQDEQFLGALREKVESGVIDTTLLAHRAAAAGPRRGTTAAPARAGPTSAAGQGRPVDLGEVRSLLDAGRTAEAVQRIQAAGDGPPEVRNAHAVCLLRLGKPEAAVTLLRRLVLPNDTMSIDEDIPDKYKLNFATALLMEGNLAGYQNALAALQDPQHPTAERLRAAVAGWRKRLSFSQRIGLAMGFVPDVPIELGFPPGEI